MGERLLEFAVRIVRLAEVLPGNSVGKHVQGQIIRSGTAPMAHHAEAGVAESQRDFIHKMKIGLKELRETERWLRLTQRVPLIKPPELAEPLIKENDELIRIFVASIKTARENSEKE